MEEKKYSKTFYDSAKWRKTERAFMSSRNCICERCGDVAKIVHHKIYITPANISNPDITLSWDNLEALCQKCHNQEHYRLSAVADGLKFDSSGNLVKV